MIDILILDMSIIKIEFYIYFVLLFPIIIYAHQEKRKRFQIM